MGPIIVSAATPKYEPHLARLKRSCDDFGLETEFFLWPGTACHEDRIAWMVNCHMIPRFCMLAAVKHPWRDIVWLDADATIERFPTLFAGPDHIDADFAVHHLRRPGGPMEHVPELLDGTMWFGGTLRREEFLRLWIDESDRRLQAWLDTDPSPVQVPPNDVWEQRVLEDNLYSWATALGMHVAELPDSYCRIFDCGLDRQPTPTEDATIIHWQGSRALSHGAGNAAASTEDVLRALPAPLLVLGNGPLCGAGCPLAVPDVGTVICMNAWWRRCSRNSICRPHKWAWAVSCWDDYDPIRASVPTFSLFHPALDQHPVAAWERRWFGVGNKAPIHMPEVSWASACAAWTMREHGFSNPSSGLILLFMLRELGIPFKTSGFTGKPGPPHNDETKAVDSLRAPPERVIMSDEEES